MQATAVQDYDWVRVQVPRVELKRFKTIVKALGCSVEKLTPIERSLREIETGQVIHCNSLEDLMKEIG